MWPGRSQELWIGDIRLHYSKSSSQKFTSASVGPHAPLTHREIVGSIVGTCTSSGLYYLRKPLNWEDSLLLQWSEAGLLFGQKCFLLKVACWEMTQAKGNQGHVLLAYSARTWKGIQSPKQITLPSNLPLCSTSSWQNLNFQHECAALSTTQIHLTSRLVQNQFYFSNMIFWL